MNHTDMNTVANHIDYFDYYAANLKSYDEMIEPDMRVRAHWMPLLENICNIGMHELDERQKEIQRLVIANGVTYNVYNDPRGIHRPWELNALPLLILEEEWKQVEAGLIQRAILMDAILTDIYNDRTLIKEGLLPLDIIYNHNGFLRQCFRTFPKNRLNLTLYAADIARGPDGRMWVLNDRTQAPSGIGYALENRLTMGRVLPELFKNIPIRKNTAFFHALRHSLTQLSPTKKENPCIVLLTPGPLNETYFEHSYLSTFLGFTLVQGGDLIVKDKFVWIKTLKGLKKVDVIVRRVDDNYCDPLELYEGSQLGVAGLLNVVRNGNVVIANPLGSAVLQNPALNAFLPNICKHLLGEELKLPTIATWWCGQELERKYVLENVNKLIIKKINRTGDNRTIFGQHLDLAQTENLKREIKDRPSLFVAQEQVSFSTSPMFTNGRMEPGYAVLRSFMVANGSTYTVMQGGLTRSASAQGKLIVSNQSGGSSSDTWILGHEPSNTSKTFLQVEDNLSVHDLATLPSRTAENLFWMGRYAARALGVARILRTVIQKLSERNFYDQLEPDPAIEILLKMLTQTTITYPGFVGEEGEENLRRPLKELLSITLDNNRPGGLSFNIQALNRASYAVRNIISMDTWRVVDRLSSQWKLLQDQKHVSLREVNNALDSLITRLAAFMGLIKESVIREQGRLLYDIGLRLEQSQLIIAKVRSAMIFKQDEMVEYTVMEAILNSTESLNIYRYTYRTHLHVRLVLELLLLDESFPNSLSFLVEFLSKKINLLPKQTHIQNNELERTIFRAHSKLHLSNSEELTKVEDDNMRWNLELLFSHLTELLFETTNLLTKNFFNHTQEKIQIMKHALLE